LAGLGSEKKTAQRLAGFEWRLLYRIITGGPLRSQVFMRKSGTKMALSGP